MNLTSYPSQFDNSQMCVWKFEAVPMMYMKVMFDWQNTHILDAIALQIVYLCLQADMTVQI